MKMSDMLKQYRETNKISQRELARRCNLSNSLISILEMGKNPQTGKEMSPDLETYRKIADGMGISIQNLFECLGEDATVSMAVGKAGSIDVGVEFYGDLMASRKKNGYLEVLASPEERNLLDAYRAADQGTQSAVKKLLDIK